MNNLLNWQLLDWCWVSTPKKALIKCILVVVFFGYHHVDFIHGLKCTLLMRYKAIFNDPNANNSTTATLFDGNYCKCNGLCDRVIYYFSRTNKYLTSVFTHLSFANFDQTYYFHFVVSNVHVWQELNASLVYGIFWIVYRKRECFSSFFFPCHWHD